MTFQQRTDGLCVACIRHFAARVNAFFHFHNVRFGSLADILTSPRHVRFTPDSGHSSVLLECPLSAISGHWVAGRAEDLGFRFRLPHHLLRDLLGGNPLRKRNERLAAPTLEDARDA